MSSMAIIAPSRHCWPEYASAPVTGCSTPTLTVFACAPPTNGKAIADAAAADLDMKWRRVLMGILLAKWGWFEVGAEKGNQWNWADSSLLTQTLASMLPTRDNCISYSYRSGRYSPCSH